MRYAKYLYIKYTKATAPSRDEMAPTIVDQENELFRSELKNIIKKKTNRIGLKLTCLLNNIKIMTICINKLMTDIKVIEMFTAFFKSEYTFVIG